MQIVILSDPSDAHIPFVSRHLSEQPIILGSESILNKEEISFYGSQDKKLHYIYKGKEIKDVDGVWLRKPYFALYEQLHVSVEYQEYCYSAIKTHFETLYNLFTEAFWISDYFAVRKANSKPLQHNIAVETGFLVPDTLFTSDSIAARNFIKGHKVSVIKTLADFFPTDPQGKKVLSMFTRRVENGEKIDLSGLYLAPAIFQEAIDIDFDIRATVVGEKVFGAKVLRHNTKGRYLKMLDYRTGYYSGSVTVEEYYLPTDIIQKCIAFVKKLHLRFGAIDLVKDKKGKIWFLENNPNGQWAFVEEETGQPIGAEIAFLLTNRRNTK